MKVKVVANNPKNQEGIEELIGKKFDVVFFDEDDDSVSVESEEFGGEIVLNRNEYEIVG